MQWDASPYAGFTKGDSTWIGVNPNYLEVNVAAQTSDPTSTLNYVKRIIELRHETRALIDGEYRLLLPEHEKLWAYTRTGADEQYLVVHNWSKEQTPFRASELLSAGDRVELVRGNYPEAADDRLLPAESRVYRVDRATPPA